MSECSLGELMAVTSMWHRDTSGGLLLIMRYSCIKCLMGMTSSSSFFLGGGGRSAVKGVLVRQSVRV